MLVLYLYQIWETQPRALQLKHIHVGHTRVAILQTNLPAFTRWANKIISIQNPEKDICRAKICLQLLRAHNLITRRRHCTESTTESKINRSTFNSHHNLSLSLLQLQQMIYHLFLFQICISTITRKLQRFNYKSTRHGTHFMRVDYELLLIIIHSVCTFTSLFSITLRWGGKSNYYLQDATCNAML